jgi:hypothetical protein
MTPSELLGTMLGRSGPTVGVALQQTHGTVAALGVKVAELAADVAALKAAPVPVGDVDEAALAAALAPLLETGASAQEIAAAVAATLATRLAS